MFPSHAGKLVGLRACARLSKRGAGALQVTLAEGHVGTTQRPTDVIALDEALNALAEIDQREKNQVVEMRFFGGMSIEETAEAMGVSVRTVKRDWTMAKLWLFRELKRPRVSRDEQ